MNRYTIRGYLYIVASAVIFGCMPLGAKLIYADGMEPLSLVFWRNILALPVLALLGLKKDGSLKLPKGALKEIFWIALFGCAVTPVLLFTSYRYISSGTATVLHFIYPAATVLGGLLLFRNKTRKGPLLCVLLCTVGICLFYDPGDPMDPKGAAVALCSGLTYATYILLLSRFRFKEVSGFKFAFFTASIASVLMLPVCLVTGGLVFPSSLGIWALTVLFSLMLCIGAVLLFQMGTFLIGGQRAAILSTFEPLTSLVVGVLVFHETVSLRTGLGSVLVLAAAVLIAVLDLLAMKKELRK